MTVEIGYVDEPPPRLGPGGKVNPNLRALLKAAEDKPGVWAVWRTDDKKEYQRVGSGLHQRRSKAFGTPGLVQFDAVMRKHPEGGYAIYVKWPEPDEDER